MIKDVPKFEYPREKALKNGISSLSNFELLAIILRTGSKSLSVLELSKKLLYEASCLKDFKEMTIQELTQIPGIGKTKAITILASIEFGFRILNEKKEETMFKKASEVYEYMAPKMRHLNEECLFVLYLDAKSALICDQMLTKGSINQTIIDCKQILKWAFKYNASAFILVHNHPSKDPTPSIHDLNHTKMIIRAAELSGLLVLDHIIIGDGFYSMKSNTSLFKN